MRTCVILNPIAGGVKDIDAIRERLRGLNPERFCISEQAGDAEKFASDAADFQLIVSAGGGGNFNEEVNRDGQGGCKTAFLALSLGTGQDFARAFGGSNKVESGE